MLEKQEGFYDNSEIPFSNNKTKTNGFSNNHTPSTTVSSSSVSIESNSSKKSGTKINTKIYDPDRHCGVCTNDTKPCTRSLSCKKHSITLRRKVNGRSRSFNDLFKQFRDNKLNDSKKASSVVVKQEPPEKKESVKLEETVSAKINDDNDTEAYSQHHLLKPISICTYGARFLDRESNYLVWNRKQDNFRSILSSAFNNYNLKIPANVVEAPILPPVVSTKQPLPFTVEQEKKVVEPIIIKLPKQQQQQQQQHQPQQQQTKLSFKRTNSLTKIKTKPISIAHQQQQPIFITSPKPSITVTPIEAFIVPSAVSSPTTTNNIKIIQTMPKSHVNGGVAHQSTTKQVQMITKKQPQLIVPKTMSSSSSTSSSSSLTTITPTITKTTKISPKVSTTTTNEFIILNGNCINKTSQQQQQHSLTPTSINGINKLTLISTPSNSTTPTKSVNLIHSPKTVQITKRCIDSLSPSSSMSTSTSPSTTIDNFTFNSPKYIKLSNGSSNGAVTPTNSNQNGAHQQSTLILTQTSGGGNTSTTVLKNNQIQKIKIPITTNLRNKS